MLKKLRWILWVVLAGGLVACGGTVSRSAPQPTSTAVVTAAPSTALPASPVAGVEVTDALGRTLHFASPPQRIVVAGKASLLVADALYAFPEAPQRIVALPKRLQTPAALDFLRLLDPALDAKLVLASDAGPEQIAALHPDLVVMKSFLAHKLGASVEALGIPVFYLQMETPEQYGREMAQLGILFGDPARGKALADFYDQTIRKVQQAVAALPASDRPRVLFLQHTVKGGTTAYKVPPASWLQTTMVKLAGGEPVWAESAQGGNWQVVNLEQIAAWNPDQIFITDYFAEPQQAVEAFKSDPTAANLTAVHNGQVFPFPKDFVSWDQPDTRWVLGLEWLVGRIHPQALPDVDLCTVAKTFYQTVYGLKGNALTSAVARCPDD